MNQDDITVTLTHSGTILRQGAASAQCAIAAAFTTGVVAYKDLGSNQDFSAYQQVSFWFYANGTVSSGVFTVRLCSDAAGATPVHTFTIPALTSGWVRLVFDNGSALNNAIRSVSIAATSDPGTRTVGIDCIFASKAPGSADELTLWTLVGINNDSPTDDDTWLPIRSLIGTTIGLDGAMEGDSQAGRAANYPLATQTTRMYLRQLTIITAAVTYSTAPTGDTAASPITIEGGWNRTDMSTKIGRTYLVRKDRSVSQWSMSAPHGLIIKSIAACYQSANTPSIDPGAFSFGSASAHSFSLEDVLAIGCFVGFELTNGDWFKTKDISCIFCQFGMYFESGTVGNGVPPISIKARNMWGVGGSGNNAIDTADANQTNERMFFIDINGGLWYNWNSVFYGQSKGTARWRIRNADVREAAAVEINTSGIIELWRYTSDVDANFEAALVKGAKLSLAGNAIEGYNWRSNWSSYSVFTATDHRKTASGYSWKMNSAGILSFGQTTTRIASVVCPANVNRTVSIWVRFNGTNISGRLSISGGKYAGIPSEITTTTSGPINTWEQISMSFTPTEDCVVDVFAQIESTTGASRTIWFDDFTAS